MIVDIGGGTTEVAVISLAGIVYSRRACASAATRWTSAIAAYLESGKYNLAIGEQTAEKLKIQIGNAYPGEKQMTSEVKGATSSPACPKTVVVNSDPEVREALTEPIHAICRGRAHRAREDPARARRRHRRQGHRAHGRGRAPPQPRRARCSARRPELPVMVSDDPISAVVLGSGKALDHMETLEKRSRSRRSPPCAPSSAIATRRSSSSSWRCRSSPSRRT